MSDENNVPWLALKSVYAQYGYTSLDAARNAVAAQRFPVMTYKLGKLIVIDKTVHAQYFCSRREAGLPAQRNNKTARK